MKITVWGCRGSLPSPGPDTIKYGGNTTCLEIRLNDKTVIIIDAGSGMRALGDKLIKDPDLKEIYLFLTHTHWDHLMGFPFFAPCYSDRFRIHICGGATSISSLKNFLEHRMEPPYFPVTFDVMKAHFDFSPDQENNYVIGTSEIFYIHLNHPNGGYGYKIIENNKSFVFLTDNELDFHHQGGLAPEDYKAFSHAADLLLHDAQYTNEKYKNTKGWGHSTFDHATDLSIDADAKRFGIFHHDPASTDADVDGFVSYCRERAAQKHAAVECFGTMEGMELIV